MIYNWISINDYKIKKQKSIKNYDEVDFMDIENEASTWMHVQ